MEKGRVTGTGRLNVADGEISMLEQFDLIRQDLAGKVVLVTGGGSGIGAAFSEAFGRYGAKVAVHAHKTGQRQLSALIDRIKAAGGAACLFKGDLSTGSACQDLIAEVTGHFGRLDVLINNAGSMVARHPLENVDDEFLDQVFNLNARSVVATSRAALPIFTRQGGGCIINVSSISARTGGSPGSSVYSAAKAFVSTLTRSLARELAPRHIRVNAIAPGTIDTAFHERFSSREKLEKTRDAIPLHRLGSAEDCVGTALYLAAESLSGYVTGQVIEVNGGQLMA